MSEEGTKQEVAQATQPEPQPIKKKRSVWKAILSNPLFWLVVSIGLLIGAIEYFERYTQIGINNTYKIF